MQAPIIPLNELQRLQRLRYLVGPISPPEQAFDDIAALAAYICGTPISLISFVDEHHQWFKSHIGLDLTQTSREVSFCGHAIAGSELFVVPDTAQDARFVDNPLVTRDPRIRFYAGTPLVTRDGLALGTLCVMDRVPREITVSQRDALAVLGRQVMGQIEIRHHANRLAESEGRLTRVFRSCPVSLAIHRWDTRAFVDVNDAFTALLGWTREEVVGRTTTELGIVDDAAAVRLRTELEEAPERRNHELRLFARDGSERHVLLSTQRVELGEEPFTVTTFVDITARQQAEQALRESESRYRTLFDCAPDGILIADEHSRYLDANASICRMLGYTRAEMIGLTAADIVDTSEVSHVEPALQAILAHDAYHREWRLRRKDGTLFSAEVIATQVPHGAIMGMVRDVSDRKRSEARLRRLVESNAQGVMFWQSMGAITSANDAFLRMVGYTREDLDAGVLHWSAMSAPAFAAADARAAEEVATKGVCTPYEKEFIRKDGTRIPVLLGAAVFDDSPDEGVSFVIDLSERKRLEQQFMRAQRLESIGTLAGGIAHDLNNVLAPIMMSLAELKLAVQETDLLEVIETL